MWSGLVQVARGLGDVGGSSGGNAAADLPLVAVLAGRMGSAVCLCVSVCRRRLLQRRRVRVPLRVCVVCWNPPQPHHLAGCVACSSV
jgi:hypothetical protein